MADLPVDDFDLLAAALRADTSDLHAWMAALGVKLAGALPDRVTLRHSGMLGRGPVEGLSADLGQWRFGLRLDHGHIVAERTHVVRNIALKSEALALDDWIDALAHSLAEISAISARERAALLNLLEGGV